MKGKNVSKNYDGLDTEERFRLSMKAAARGDDREQARLSGTCPRETYSMPEAEYLDRLKAADRLTCAYVMGLEYQHGKLAGLELAEGALGALPGLAQMLFQAVYREGFLDVGGDDPTDEKLKELDLEVEALMCSVRRLIALTKRVIACRVRMETEVFEKVCRENMGVEPEEPLGAAEAQEVLNWLDIESLESAGADIEGLQPEELDLDTIRGRIEKDLQEDREMMEGLYVAAWDKAVSGRLE